MKGKIFLILSLLLISSCSKYEPDQAYELCDVCAQEPKIIIIDSIKLYIPDLISPNNDGINDYFTILCKTPTKAVQLTEIFTDVKFELFGNRSKSIFEVENQNVIFSGLDSKGNNIGDGIYTYSLTLDNQKYSRLLGVYASSICLLDFNCDGFCVNITEFSSHYLPYQSDPIFYNCE
jgi:hypothetical protein